MIKLRHPAHIIAGIICPLSFIVNPILPLVLTLLFCVYEITQWLKEKDDLHLDIREFTVAVFVITTILIILRFML